MAQRRLSLSRPEGLRPLYIAQKPIAACHGKQLKLHDQGGAVFAAHKQKFMGISRDSFVMISAARASQTGRTEAVYFRPLP
jgi:hypothetical protein